MSSIEENGNDVIDETIEKPKKKKILTDKQKEALEKGRKARQENLNRLSKIVKKEKIKKLQEEIGEVPTKTETFKQSQKSKPKPKKKVVYTYQSESDDDDDDDDGGNETPPQQPVKINKPKRRVNTPKRKDTPKSKPTKRNDNDDNQRPKYTPSIFFV